MLAGIFILYLLAAWWAFKDFGEHKITALLSPGFCAFGIGLYVVGFVMETGNRSIK